MKFSYAWTNAKRYQAGRSEVEAENEEAAREKLARVWPARTVHSIVPFPQVARFHDDNSK